MPSTIQSQNFDSVTVPNLPSGWTTDASGGFVTASDQFTSSPNAAKASSQTGSKVLDGGVLDPGSGNVSVSAKFRGDTISSITQLYARGTNTQVPYTNANHYELRMTWGVASTACQLLKRTGGSSVQLGSAISGASAVFALSSWYIATLTCNGTTISAQVQRVSDSQWLTSAGTWGASQVDAINVTDSSISGKGTAGVTAAPGASGNSWVDDFVFTSLDSATIAASPAAVSSGQTGVAITLTGTGTSWTPGTPGSPTFTGTSTGTGFSITGQTIASATSATLTINTGTAGTITITDPSTGATCTVAVAQFVAINDANCFLSPGVWAKNGAVSASTVNPGAYIRLGFTGTSLRMLVDVSPLVTGSESAGNYPAYRGHVDHGIPLAGQLTSSSSSVTLATGLAAGNHELFLPIDTIDGVTDKWNTPVDVFRLLGFYVDSGATTVAPTLRSKRMLVYGDSVSYGIETRNRSGASAANSAVLSPFFGVAEALDAEFGLVGFGSTGYSRNQALANVPRLWTSGDAAHTTWDKYYSTQSRLSAGSYIDGPFDYIFLYEGTADWSGGMLDSDVTAGCTGSLLAIRAAAPTARIFCTVPANRQKLAAITSGFDGAFGGHASLGAVGDGAVYKATADSKAFLIDLGAKLSQGCAGGGQTFECSDGYHPDGDTNLRISNRIAALARLVIDGNSGGSRRGIITGGQI